MQIGLENGLLLLALVDVLLAQAHHGAQRLGVVSVGFGFPVDIADVVSDRLLLFLQALDAFDEGFELILGEAMGGGGGLIVLDGSGGLLLYLLFRPICGRALRILRSGLVAVWPSRLLHRHQRSPRSRRRRPARSLLPSNCDPTYPGRAGRSFAARPES